MASFAKAQLLKYGWTEGKGLGKNENGIVDALKPKLKFDTTGVGHDSKEYKWWENVYNKAASNVEVDVRATEISVKIRDEDAVNISSSRLDIKKLRKTHNLQYGSFVKTCTLDNGKVVPEENASGGARSALDELVHETPSFELTDEQLFLACGGRTAHKGARHGLKLSGKLARIAQQEAEMLGLPQRSLSESADWQEVKKKSKRKRRRSAAEMDLDALISTDGNSLATDANANNVTVSADDSPSTRALTPESRRKSKRSRRKEKRRVQSLVHQLGSVALVEDSADNETKKRKLKKKQKQKQNEANERECVGEETNENENPRVFPVENTIELADGNIITLDSEDERESDAKATKKRKRDVKEADKLNHRIAKKKTKHQAKMQRRRVDRLSECLMAVNLCEDSVDSGRGEDLVESCEASKKLKKWKKHRKEKKDKRLEDAIILDP